MAPGVSAADEAFADDMLRAMLSEGDDPQESLPQQQQQPMQRLQRAVQQQASLQPQQQQQQQHAAQQQQRHVYQQQQQQPRYQQAQEGGMYHGAVASTFVPDPSTELLRQVGSACENYPCRCVGQFA